MADAERRVSGRRRRAQIAGRPTSLGTIRLETPHSDLNGHVFQLHDAMGTTSTAFVNSQINSISAMAGPDPDRAVERINAVVALVDGIRPETELEAVLAVQIGVTHQASMEMLAKMTTTMRPDHVDRYATIATKLQRTMVAPQ